MAKQKPFKISLGKKEPIANMLFQGCLFFLDFTFQFFDNFIGS